MPDVGLIDLVDAETGEAISIDTGSAQIRNDFYQSAFGHQEELKSLFRSIGVDHIDILTDRSYVEPITRFFRMRSKRLAV